MMKIKVTKDKEVRDNIPGTLYLVMFELEGKTLIKIGVTSRSIEERVSEILVSMFKVYREFPFCRPKRFRQTSDAYGKETVLHNYFKEYIYTTDKKFSGSTEFFDIPIDDAVHAYEHLLAEGHLDDYSGCTEE